MDQLSIVDATSSHAVGHTDSAVFYVWRGVTTIAGARAFEQAVRNVVSRSNRAGLMLGIVHTNAPPPTADVRKALAEGMAAGAGTVLASALVFEGQGFRASMVRAVATGLAMLARPPYPHESFASVSTAAHWLGLHRDAGGRIIASASALEAHLHELRTTSPK